MEIPSDLKKLSVSHRDRERERVFHKCCQSQALRPKTFITKMAAKKVNMKHLGFVTEYKGISKRHGCAIDLTYLTF